MKNISKCRLLKLFTADEYFETSENVLLTCASSEYTDQPVHARSLVRISTGPFWVAKDAKYYENISIQIHIKFHFKKLKMFR